MKVEIEQAPFVQTSFGYRADADYVVVWTEEIDSEGRSTQQVLDEVWTRFQRIDPDTGEMPPEGYEGRSLSVGDVIVLDGERYAVEPLGYKPVAEAEGYSFGWGYI